MAHVETYTITLNQLCNMTCLLILSPIIIILTIYLTHERILTKKDTREQKRIEKKKVEYFNQVDYNSDKK